MRSTTAPVLDSRWPAVHRLIDRWAALPAPSWRLLIEAERVAVDGPPIDLAPGAALGAPCDYTQWVIRDLVQTAWWMASHSARVDDVPWSAEARAALERAALRLVQQRAVTVSRAGWRSIRDREVGHG